MVHLTMTNKALIGFVGLGNMGAHMAKNLMKKGNELIVFDVNSQSVKELVKLGAKSSSSPADLASKTKHIITMLPSHPHVNEVFTSKSGILSAIQKETLCIDCSTIDVVASRKIASLCEEKFAQFNDAPVSGGVKGAEFATLTYFLYFKVLACTFIKIGQTTFLSFVPWNNYQGFRIYAKTVKYFIQSKFPPKNNLFNLNSME